MKKATKTLQQVADYYLTSAAMKKATKTPHQLADYYLKADIFTPFIFQRQQLMIDGKITKGLGIY